MFAQAGKAASDVVILSPSDMIKWGTPKTLPLGAHDLVLNGYPQESGPYTIRLKLPAGYKIPPYSQTAATYTTVISGSYCIGIGQSFDVQKGKCIPQGGYIIIPANVWVYTWTTTPTVIQLSGQGPLKIIQHARPH